MLRKKLKLKSTRLTEKRRKKVIKKITLYLLFIFSLVVGGSYLSSADFLSVKDINIKGAGEDIEKEITDIVEKKIEGKIVGLFSKSNIFLFPRSNIKAEILGKIYGVSEARVSLSGLSSMSIFITERKPFGIWCAEIESHMVDSSAIDLAQDKQSAGFLVYNTVEKCFYIDEDSFLFDEVDGKQERKENFLKYYGGLQDGVLGSYVVDKKIHSSIRKFFEDIKTISRDVNIERVMFEEQSFNVFLSTGTKLILNRDQDLQKAVDNLTILMNDKEFKKGLGRFESFEYIDLRFGNKLFYRLK